MNDAEKIYEDSNFETYFDSKKDWYWLILKNQEPHFFFEKGTLQDFTGLDLLTFMRRMNSYNPLVIFAAKSNNISEPERAIKKVLEETKKREDRILEEYLRTNQ